MPATYAVIKSSADFQLISRQGKRWSCPSFSIQALRREATAPFRLGLTASRKVGNAVTRNRAKRRLREIVRHFMSARKLEGWDIVLVARTASASTEFKIMQEDFARGLATLGAS